MGTDTATFIAAKQLIMCQESKPAGTRIQPQNNWKEYKACQLNEAQRAWQSLDIPPSSQWQFVFIFALMKFYFPCETIKL